MPTQGSVRVIRFGDYALDLGSGELRKHDHKIPLPDQAIQILSLLLERPGEVVTREQLIARLWPNGTVVEFDHGINSSVRRLRAALNDSADQPRHIETLPKRGYRFIAPVQWEGWKIRAENQTETVPAPEQHSGSSTRWKWTWIGIAAVGLSALLGVGVFRWRTAPTQSIHSIAILPLTNITHDPGTEYLSDGISEEIINTLSTAPRLRVIARTSAFRFKGKEIDPRKAGRELGVEAVLTGTLAQHGDALVVQTDLVNVADGSELWGEQYQRFVSQIQGVQGEIASDIARKLRLKLAGQQQDLLAKRYTNNSEAYQLYLKAIYSRSDAKESLQYLNGAIAKDPQFALAYVGLAGVYGGLGTLRVLPGNEAYSKEKAAALKALSIDDTLPEAHLQLAQAVFQLDWDWAAAERAFRRATELNSNYAHLPYALYLMQVGRLQEGLAEAHTAEEVDPLSPSTLSALGFIYYMARDYDRALEALKAANPQGKPFFPHAFVLAGKGRYEEAIAEFQQLGPSTAARGHLAHAYAMAGKAEEAKAILRELEASAQKRQVGAYEAGFTYGALGNKDRAFIWLNKAYEQRDPGLTYLKVDSCLDPLRSDPRFDELLRRVGLAS